MWRKKKFILIAILVPLVVVGSLVGVALAQTASTDNAMVGKSLAGSTANTTAGNTLLARVAKILGIDQTKVENAFTQARKDMQNEAMDSYLKNLVTEGKITQAQADQYKTWWQSKPDMTQEKTPLRAWTTKRAEVPLPGSYGGRGFMGGMGGGQNANEMQALSNVMYGEGGALQQAIAAQMMPQPQTTGGGE